MNYNGSYYLWDPRNCITVGSVLEAEPGMVKVELGQLHKALATLQEKAAAMGRSRCVEIHCHGLPARLLLGTDLGVSRANVDSFGRQLQDVIMAGGLIEILACMVAAQTRRWGQILRTEPRNIAGYVAEYHGKIQELYMGRRWQTTQGLVMTGASFSPNAIKPFKPDEQFVPQPDENGLEFCRSLARTTRATVRAAITVQGEEAALISNDWTPAVSPIGSWEGPVFDFSPDGSVRCLGMAPFRATSFGPIRMDTSFPLGVA